MQLPSTSLYMLLAKMLLVMVPYQALSQSSTQRHAEHDDDDLRISTIMQLLLMLVFSALRVVFICTAKGCFHVSMQDQMI